MSIIVPQLKVVFNHIPRTAGISISQWLKDNVLGEHVAPFHGLLDKPGWQTFAVVRNPWVRALSFYKHVHQLAADYGMSKMFGPGSDERPKQFFKLFYMIQDKSFTFEQFVLDPQWMEQLVIPMEHWVSESCTVMKLENIETDFALLQTATECNKPLALSLNHGKKNIVPGWNDQMVNRIGDVYKRDIYRWHYQFNEEDLI